MELFIHPASPNCVAALAVARHLRQHLQVHTVDVMNGEHRGSEFRNLNPNGLVPVLRDGSFVLWETTAILSYFADVSPQGRLLPADAQGRSDVARWLSWGLAHWNVALQPFIYERVFKPMKQQGVSDEPRLQALVPKLHELADILDRRLAGHAFVGGDAISIADFYLAAFPMYSQAARLDFTGFRDVARWLSRMHALPEWMASVRTGAPMLDA